MNINMLMTALLASLYGSSLFAVQERPRRVASSQVPVTTSSPQEGASEVPANASSESSENIPTTEASQNEPKTETQAAPQTGEIPDSTPKAEDEVIEASNEDSDKGVVKKLKKVSLRHGSVFLNYYRISAPADLAGDVAPIHASGISLARRVMQRKKLVFGVGFEALTGKSSQNVSTSLSQAPVQFRLLTTQIQSTVLYQANKRIGLGLQFNLGAHYRRIYVESKSLSMSDAIYSDTKFAPSARILIPFLVANRGKANIVGQIFAGRVLGKGIQGETTLGVLRKEADLLKGQTEFGLGFGAEI